MRHLRLKMCAVTALALAVAATGCHRRSRGGNVAVADDDIFTTDDFPGSSVQDGNVADDGRALSNSGENVSGVTCQFNGDRGTAIVTYLAKGAEPTAPVHVYAQYFDGKTWTPPVVLEAPDVDFTQSASPGVVAFINTSEHASDAAKARDGDAIIVWGAVDIDGDGVSFFDGPNLCRFATYFDVTHAAEPGKRYGFQELGVRISERDQADENAGAPVIVTDGLCGEHRDPQRTVKYGDQTTGIVICWPQHERNDLLSAFTNDNSVWYTSFDLAAPGDPETPLVPRPSLRLPVLGFGASDAGLSSEETEVDGFTVEYNNVLFCRVASRVTAGSGTPGNNFPATGLAFPYGATTSDGDDVTLQYYAFDLLTGTFAGPSLLDTAAPDSTDSSESSSEFLKTNAFAGLFSTVQDTQSIYGSDEGLAQLVVFFCELTDDPDMVTDFGTGLQDGALVARGIDEATGALQAGVILSTDDPAIFDTVIEGDVATRISRNGDYIWVAWLQPELHPFSNDLALHCAQITTTRPAEDGSFTLPPLSTATSLTLTLSGVIDGFDVGWLQFQDGLGYVCGAQSDPDVMNLFFEHSNGSLDEVFQVRLTADLHVPPVPAASVTSFETFEDGQIAASHINDKGLNFNSIDSGEGGNVLAVFRQDIDTTATDDFRFFARRTGAGAGKVEIDSASPLRQATDDVIKLVATPPGESIGTFDPVSLEDSPDRPHPAGIVHILFREDRYVHGSGTGSALRARAFDARDSSVALGDTLLPPAGTIFQAPFDLEVPGADPDAKDAPKIDGVGIDGTTVGVWFAELGHVYYQEFSEDTGSWLYADGVSNPILLDDDSPIETTVALFFSKTCTCTNLHGASIFWIKELDPGSGDGRLQVRVRE